MLAAIAQTDTGLLVLTAVGRRARLWDGRTATARVIDLPVAATRACAVGLFDEAPIVAVADESAVSVVDIGGTRVCRDILVGPGVTELELDGASRELTISSESRRVVVIIGAA